MAYQPHGRQLIAGEWVGASETFSNEPAEGEVSQFSAGTPEDVARAAMAAEMAFEEFAAVGRATRGVFLNRIANEIEARGDDITDIGSRETGLPAGRIENERGRTCGQLRLFAHLIESGDYLDRRHDPALPDRKPLARPDLRLIQVPIGPAAVFGASNFPLAFSVAGGDTVSALAAGCPVVVRGHPAHPGTSEVVAESVKAAVEACGLPGGVFSLLQSNKHLIGTSLVMEPRIRAVGFTGSLAGGRALFNLCAARPEPIPFFGELGSINPVFLLGHAMKNRASEIGASWVASLTLGAGQFCTNPGLCVLQEGDGMDAFTDTALAALSEVPEQTMLTRGIACAFESGRRAFLDSGAEDLISSDVPGRTVRPSLFRISAQEWLERPELHEEVFGPLGTAVVVQNFDQMLSVAKCLKGQLTCTLHVEAKDYPQARALMPVLTRKAGRVLVNGFPTGVEVADAMVHGGPYPASTNFGATSVGTMAIRRFLRPVSYQNVPAELLPEDLQ